MLTPLLGKYPASALLIIATGLYLGTIISIGLRQALVGTLVAVGCAFVPGAGQVDFSLAVTVMKALLLGIMFAIASQHIVYPFFPEDPPGTAPPAPPPADPVETRWIALRSTLIVLVPVTMAFVNPAMFLSVIMKSVMLSQQASVLNARTAGRAIVGATFLGGLFAILFWFGLKLWPSLWMFFLLMLLLSLYIAAKAYGVLASRHPASFLAGRDIQLPVHILSGRRRQRERQGPVRGIRGPVQPFRNRHLVRMGRHRCAGMAARAPCKTAAMVAAQGAR